MKKMHMVQISCASGLGASVADDVLLLGGQDVEGYRTAVYIAGGDGGDGAAPSQPAAVVGDPEDRSRGEQ